jgi:NAD(P)H-hydrate epimerase
VADAEGNCWFNQTGNDGMATGGSGDVLSGIIGSFLAQGMEPVEAALAGVFIHGLAGDLAAEAYTERAMVAGDIIDLIPRTFSLLEG